MNKQFIWSQYANCDEQIEDIKLSMTIMHAENEPLQFDKNLIVTEFDHEDHEDHENEYEDGEVYKWTIT